MVTTVVARRLFCGNVNLCDEVINLIVFSNVFFLCFQVSIDSVSADHKDMKILVSTVLNIFIY